MAAGLAHELNNPASAALRAASDLRRASERAQSCLCPLGDELDNAAWAILLAAEADAKARLQLARPLDSLTRSDKEDEIAAWLDGHSIAESWKLSASLVEAGLDTAWLESLTQSLPPASHPAAIGWIEARLNLEILLRQVENSTSRVSELVKAVKSYSHMDKAAMDEMDIHEGLESTLTMLNHKLKGVTVQREYDRTIPRFRANGGELNQVWTNLIDNAIHAVKGTGKIQVRTIAECDHVLVEIVDNGSGIPPEAQAHMFEPFFTTKSVGTGTGLGLVISNRIVADRHGGEIEFESKPGETRFRVRLPLRRDPASKN
jgi:signal transduction histidine kinase